MLFEQKIKILGGQMEKHEKNRKLLHIISGTIIPLAILTLPHFVITLGLEIATIVYIVIEILRLNFPASQKIFNKLFETFLREEEKRKLTGAAWILISATICVYFFEKEIAAIVINLSIWGDAVAGYIGIKSGRIKIGKKSLEGSVACLSLCILLMVFVYPLILQHTLSSLFIIVVALSITVLEVISDFLPLDDNLIIPVVTGIIITLLF